MWLLTWSRNLNYNAPKGRETRLTPSGDVKWWYDKFVLDSLNFLIVVFAVGYNHFVFTVTDTCHQVPVDIPVSDVTYLTSPNYPDFYEPSTECVWFFIASDNTDTFVVIFLHFEQRGSDYLSIGSTHDMLPNNTVSKKGYWYAPNRVMVHHHRMWIQFESNNNTYVDLGFFIKIETHHQNSTGMFCLAVWLVKFHVCKYDHDLQHIIYQQNTPSWWVKTTLPPKLPCPRSLHLLNDIN